MNKSSKKHKTVNNKYKQHTQRGDQTSTQRGATKSGRAREDRVRPPHHLRVFRTRKQYLASSSAICRRARPSGKRYHYDLYPIQRIYREGFVARLLNCLLC